METNSLSFFLQLNNRTNIYKTMETIDVILIIMLMLCSYQLGKLRTLDWVNKKLRD